MKIGGSDINLQPCTIDDAKVTIRQLLEQLIRAQALANDLATNLVDARGQIETLRPPRS